MLRMRPRLTGFIEPCLPSPAPNPPAGDGWIHEIKLDGFRLLARRDAARDFGVEAEPNYLELENGGRLLTEEGMPLRLEEDFFRLSHVGFENKEGRDVIDEAIKWWRKQLDAIEAQL